MPLRAFPGSSRYEHNFFTGKVMNRRSNTPAAGRLLALGAPVPTCGPLGPLAVSRGP